MKKNHHRPSPLSGFSTDTALPDLQAIASKKLPTWSQIEGISFPTRLALEQCSGEQAAQYKSQLAGRLYPDGGECMADLTGGLGVDFSFIARHFKRAIYIERQEVLCQAARNNFPKLGLTQAEIREANGIDEWPALPETDLIFIDPARRNQMGRKTVLIEDCEPDVSLLLPALWQKTRYLLLKLSPMLDLNRALKTLKEEVCEAHIVADGGECKELLLLLCPGAKEARIYCTDNDRTFSFLPQEETEATANYTDQLRSYLYEPGPALLKAGAFKLMAQRYQIEKLHPNSHLYTSDRYIPDFPGRSFRIRQVSGFSKKELKALCLSVDKANLTIRNFPGSVAELRKRLKLKEGGDAYWFATTLNNQKHVIIDCRKTSGPCEDN